MVPRSASSSPAIVRKSVLLPQPDWPTSYGELARRNLQVNAAHGVHLPVVFV